MVMPNHLHGLILIDRSRLGFHFGRARGPAPTISRDSLSLSDLVQRFKSWTTRQYFDMRPSSLVGRLWQRNYFEHVIRNDGDLDRVREYIRNNPKNWDTDPENPEAA